MNSNRGQFDSGGAQRDGDRIAGERRTAATVENSAPAVGQLDEAQVAMEAGRERSTRDRLLDAAMELFHANGYHATGISAILKRAEVNSGSLYYFFPTKEDLLLALLDRYKEMLHPWVLRPVFERISDPIERIFGVLEGYRQMLIATDCSLGCPIGNLALELADTHTQAREKLHENFENWRRAIRSCFDGASDRLPPNSDTDSLATFVLTVMEGAMMQAKTHKSLDRFEASVEQLRNYVDRLLAEGREWRATN